MENENSMHWTLIGRGQRRRRLERKHIHNCTWSATSLASVGSVVLRVFSLQMIGWDRFISRVGWRIRYFSSSLFPASVVLRKWRAAPISATVIRHGWVLRRSVTCGMTLLTVFFGTCLFILFYPMCLYVHIKLCTRYICLMPTYLLTYFSGILFLLFIYSRIIALLHYLYHHTCMYILVGPYVWFQANVYCAVV